MSPKPLYMDKEGGRERRVWERVSGWQYMCGRGKEISTWKMRVRSNV